MAQIPYDERRTREEMTSLQLQRLQQTLTYAGDNVAFYRRLFHEHRITPQDITSLDRVSQLPFSRKSDLVENYPYGMCAVKPSQIVRLHASSGTTGQPINTYYTRKDQEDWQKCMGRNCSIAGITKDDVCQIAFRYTLFTGAFGHHLGAESCGAMVIPTSSGQTERQIMMMQNLKTTVLHCTPSYALVVAEKLKELGIDPKDLSLRLGIHGAETHVRRDAQACRNGSRGDSLEGLRSNRVGRPGCVHRMPAQIRLSHQRGLLLPRDHRSRNA